MNWKRYSIILCLLLLTLPLIHAQNEDWGGLKTKMTERQLLNMADAALVVGNRPDSALIYNIMLITKLQHKKRLTAEEKRYIAIGYNRSGFIYMFYLFDYASAMECLIKANQYCEDEKLRISINQNMGHLYSLYAVCFPSANNVEAARHYYRKAFNKALQMKDWTNMVSSFINFWNFGLEKENINAFRKQTDLFEQTHITKPTPHQQYARMMLKVVRALQKKRYAEATAILKKQMKYGRNSIDDRLRCASCWHIASIYKMAGQRDSALAYSLKLEQMGRTLKLKDVETDADKLLCALFNEKGKKESADRYQLAYYRNRDSLLIANNLNSVKNNHLLSNVRSLANEVSNLKQKRRLQNLLALLSAGIVLITIAFLIILFRKNRRLKNQNITLYQRMQLQIAGGKPKYSKSNLDEEGKSMLRQKIEKVMKESEEIYNEDFSIEQLAKLCHAGKKDISQVINEKFGQSFILLLSEYRVKEACRRMNDITNSQRFTLESIGHSVGFKARESFSRAFKRVTGLSPSDYQKIAKTHTKA